MLDEPATVLRNVGIRAQEVLYSVAGYPSPIELLLACNGVVVYVSPSGEGSWEPRARVRNPTNLLSSSNLYATTCRGELDITHWMNEGYAHSMALCAPVRSIFCEPLNRFNL